MVIPTSNLRLIYLISFFLFLSSCAMEPWKEQEKPKAGESVVFGHVDVIFDGEKQDCGYPMGIAPCYLIILPEGSAKAISIPTDDMFYLSLKPGQYQVLGFHLQFRVGNINVGRIDAHFTVPDGAEAVYIGNITIAGRDGRYGSRIANKMSEPMNAYKTKYPDRTGSIATSLIKYAKPVGEYSDRAEICSSRWGIDCGGEFQGVVPIYPDGDVEQFPEINSLTPTLSWKPVPDKGLTYDLIIYDAVTYITPTMSDEQTIKGRVVLYKENVKNANFKLVTSLKPGTKYYWSIRLRDPEDEVVSNWSTHSQSESIPFFYRSSHYGKWFTFRTP